MRNLNKVEQKAHDIQYRKKDRTSGPQLGDDMGWFGQMDWFVAIACSILCLIGAGLLAIIVL